MDQPLTYSPDNEPYLGSEALLCFDKNIPFCLWVSSHIAKYTHNHRNELTDLQQAACIIIPQGVNLALSIRELIRQGYLFAAYVLIRPLIERAATISFLCNNPGEIVIWKDGWRFRKRPKLADMLKSMAGKEANLEDVKSICDHYNHIIHGDPQSADSNRITVSEGIYGYSVGKVLNNPSLCDELAIQGLSYLQVLTGRAMKCFPEVKPPSEEEPDIGAKC